MEELRRMSVGRSKARAVGPVAGWGEYMFTHSWFTSLCSRNEHNIVKQLYLPPPEKRKKDQLIMLVPREASRSTKELSNLTLKWQIKDLEIDPNVHDKSISHCLPLKKKKKKLASKVKTKHSAKISGFLYRVEERVLSHHSGLRPQSHAMKKHGAWVRTPGVLLCLPSFLAIPFKL